jgi:antitoxin HicB
MTNAHVGSSFANVMEKEGMSEEVTALAIKRVLARQIQQAMAQQGLTKSAMAQRMNTSRSQHDRLLDSDNVHVQLITLQRAAAVVGRQRRIDLM